MSAAGSIGRQVAARGTALLVGSLAVAGLATAVVLHLRQVEGLDRALLAAAHGHAHPEVEESWEAEHSRSPIAVWVVLRGDERVPAALAREASRAESTVVADVGEDRLLLLPMEGEEAGDEEEQHRLVAARARRVTVARSVGAFGVIYTVFAVLVSAVGAWTLRRTVSRALAPVGRARHEAAAVLGLGEGKRLSTDVPEELAGLLVGFNELLDRLDAAAQAQGRFTAEAAHELRTPVAALLGEIEVALRRERTAAEYREVLVSARDEVERLRQVVKGLTALARVDAGEIDGHRVPIRAAELARAVVSAEAAAITSAGCSVQVEVQQDPEIEVHEALVITALGNLVRNAARHAPGSEVRLTVSQAGDRVIFDVDDAGPGVADGEREALFNRFARSGEARRRDPAGLGLGLPIARQVARRHGGDCVLLASPLGGARARLTLRLPG